MTPKRSPACTTSPCLDAAHDAPRQHADDLPDHDRLTVVVDRDLGELVEVARRCAVAGRKRPG